MDKTKEDKIDRALSIFRTVLPLGVLAYFVYSELRRENIEDETFNKLPTVVKSDSIYNVKQGNLNNTYYMELDSLRAKYNVQSMRFKQRHDFERDSIKQYNKNRY